MANMMNPMLYTLTRPNMSPSLPRVTTRTDVTIMYPRSIHMSRVMFAGTSGFTPSPLKMAGRDMSTMGPVYGRHKRAYGGVRKHNPLIVNPVLSLALLLLYVVLEGGIGAVVVTYFPAWVFNGKEYRRKLIKDIRYLMGNPVPKLQHRAGWRRSPKVIYSYKYLYMPMETTTIQLKKRTRARLEKLKISNRESIDAVIERLLDIPIDPEPLSKDEIDGIRQSLKDIDFKELTASLDAVPRMMRSGQLKSSTAQPLVKNMGWQTSRLFRPPARSDFSSWVVEPTRTGVTTDKT